MRTEFSRIPPGLLSTRMGYGLDKDGSHAAAGKPVAVLWFGVKGPEEFLAIALSSRINIARKSRRGAPKRFVAIEITAHALDVTGNETCFRDCEMRTIALALMIQFGAPYCLVCMHGKSDVHVILINQTADGLALRSTFPNNATPRRVMVAVCDRLEREFNRERPNLGLPLLKSVEEVRADVDIKHGRKSMHQQIAQRLIEESGSANSVDDIINAMRALGWSAVRLKKRAVNVKFAEYKPIKTYELDLLLRGVAKAYERVRKLQIEREKAEKEKEANSQKPPKISPSVGNVLPSDAEGVVERQNTPPPRDATPDDVAKWAERVAIYLKTPQPTDGELADVLKRKVGILRSYDPSGSVVITDLGSKVPLRIQLTQLRSACLKIWEKRHDGPNPGEFPGPSR